MTWAVTADPAQFDEALDWFRSRTVMTGPQARQLDDRLKSEAFWVGAGLQADQIERVFDQIDKALATGVPLDEFKRATIADLPNPHHAETVFRNATQRAYNAGRWQQMQDPDVRAVRPFGLVDALLDDRTTEYCESVNGTILPLDHPWWLNHWFPAHHRCRTSVRNIRRREAERRGITFPPPSQQPAPGFGQAPGTGAEWLPQPKDVRIATELGRKSTKGTTHRVVAPSKHEREFWEPRYTKQYGDGGKSVAHGRAAYERGLDMTVGDVRKALERLDIPTAQGALENMRDLDAGRTMRSVTGEIEPIRMAAAAIAGHLKTLPKRDRVKHRGLSRSVAGKRALGFFNQMTGPDVDHPTDWSFAKIKTRSSANPARRRIRYRDEPGELEHEWSHALEEINPDLMKRATAFLKGRTKGEALRSLRTLTGKPWYRDNERARRDKFANPYTGKAYERADGTVWATEITSMSVEALVAGERGLVPLSELIRGDFEHFLFGLGQLAG